MDLPPPCADAVWGETRRRVEPFCDRAAAASSVSATKRSHRGTERTPWLSTALSRDERARVPGFSTAPHISDEYGLSARKARTNHRVRCAKAMDLGHAAHGGPRGPPASDERHLTWHADTEALSRSLFALVEEKDLQRLAAFERAVDQEVDKLRPAPAPSTRLTTCSFAASPQRSAPGGGRTQSRAAPRRSTRTAAGRPPEAQSRGNGEISAT